MLAVVAAPWLVLPRSAQAGTYQVRVCDAASTTSAVNNAWNALTNTNTTVLGGNAGLDATNGCPSGGDSNKGFRTFSNLNAGTAANGQHAALTATAPAGSTVSALTVRYRAFLSAAGMSGRVWRSGIVAQDGGTNSQLVAGCSDRSTDCDAGSYAVSTAVSLPTWTTRLLLLVQCRDAAGCTTNATRAARAGIGAAWITINDPLAPTLSGVSGLVTTSTSTQWLRGNQQFTYSASDGGGILVTNFTVDGATYWDEVPEAGCPTAGWSSSMQPCPNVTSRSSTVVTTAYTNGSHAFRIYATDYTSSGSFNNTGYWPSSTGRTIYVDNLAPNAPASVADGTGADVDWQASSTGLSANWPAGTDAHSGINDHRYCFSTALSCGGTVIAQNWTTGTSVSVTATLVNGTRYYACVHSRDRALDTTGAVGNVSGWQCSDGVTVDTSNPIPPASVADGTGADITWQSSTTSLAANWPAGSDAGSGVQDYEYCFSTLTSCGGTLIASGFTAGLTITRTGLVLTGGTMYHACVRTRDNAGRLSGWRCSNGVTVDSTSPVAPTSVADGTGADIDWQASTTSLSANWPAGSDGHSGVRDYEYCFATLTSCGGTVVATAYVASLSVTRAGLALTGGATYFACVRTRDNVDRLSAWRCSNGVTVDVTAPTAPAAVADGTGADVDWQASTSSVSANWTAGSDAHSGVADYEYCVATAAACGGTLVVSGSTASLTVTRSGLVLTGGTTYYACVRSRDRVGLLSAWTCSDGVTVDASAPVAPASVLDGTGADITWQQAGTSLSANWPAGSDVGSGLRDYEWCFSSSTPCAGTIVGSGFTTALGVTRSGLALASGSQWFACVRSRDDVDRVSGWRCSNGVTVDSVAPTITDNQPGDAAWRRTDSTAYDVDFADALSLARFETMVWSGPAQGGTMLQGWTQVATLSGTSHVADWALAAGTFAALQEGTNYVSVRVFDAAGNSSILVDAFSVDKDTAAPAVIDTLTATVVGAQRDLAWSQAADATSGTAFYRVYRSTSSGTLGVQISADGGPTAGSFTDAAALADGSYWYTVRAVDAAGNENTSTGNEQVRVSIGSLAVTGASPSSAPQGRRGAVLQVAGTGFAAGATMGFSGTGVTVTSLTVVSSTRIDVTIDVAAGAVVGARDVTVTLPNTEQATAAGAFSVTAPVMTIGVTARSHDGTTGGAVAFGTLLAGDQQSIAEASSVSLTTDTDTVLMVSGTDFARSGGGPSLPVGAYEWRAAGGSTWTAMSTAGVVAAGPFLPGTHLARFDGRMWIPAAQPPGAYGSTVTYTVVAVP